MPNIPEGTPTPPVGTLNHPEGPPNISEGPLNIPTNIRGTPKNRIGRTNSLGLVHGFEVGHIHICGHLVHLLIHVTV